MRPGGPLMSSSPSSPSIQPLPSQEVERVRTQVHERRRQETRLPSPARAQPASKLDEGVYMSHIERNKCEPQKSPPRAEGDSSESERCQTMMPLTCEALIAEVQEELEDWWRAAEQEILIEEEQEALFAAANAEVETMSSSVLAQVGADDYIHPLDLWCNDVQATSLSAAEANALLQDLEPREVQHEALDGGAGFVSAQGFDAARGVDTPRQVLMWDQPWSAGQSTPMPPVHSTTPERLQPSLGVHWRGPDPDCRMTVVSEILGCARTRETSMLALAGDAPSCDASTNVAHQSERTR